MKSISKNKILITIIVLSALLRIVGGLIFLKEIPKTYGWYRIANNVIAGEKTLLTTGYSLDNGNEVLIARYYLVRPPIYVLFYVFIIYLFKGTLLSYLIFQSIISAVSIYVAFLLFNKFLSEKIALIGSAMVAFYPYFVTRVWNATEDNLYIMFILISFLFIFRFFDSKKIMYLFFSGFTIGMTYLVRSTILFFVILLIPLIFFLVKKRKIFCVIIFISSFIIPLTPWLFYGYSIYGQFVMADHNGSRFWVANNNYVIKLFPKIAIDRIEGMMWNELSYKDFLQLTGKGQLEREKILLRRAKDFIIENPWLSIRSGMKKAFSALTLKYNPESAGKNMKLRNVFHFAFYLPLFFFGLIGILLYGRKYKIQCCIFITYSMSLIFMAFFLWAHTRHTIPYHLTYIFGVLIYLEHNKDSWPLKCLKN